MADQGVTKERTPEMFDAIAARYDRVNAVLSFGMHQAWRERMVQASLSKDGLTVLDLATGTADVAMALAQYPSVVKVIGIDPATKMLAIGKDKIAREGLAEKVELSTGDAMALDQAEDSFDVVTCAFGIRNMPNLVKVLMEVKRVLKEGGRVVILEFSRPHNGLFRFVHGIYLKGVLPLVGAFLTGDHKAYRYLADSVDHFPSGQRFERILKQVALTPLQRVPLALGAVSLYIAEKNAC